MDNAIVWDPGREAVKDSPIVKDQRLSIVQGSAIAEDPGGWTVTERQRNCEGPRTIDYE